MGLFTRLKFWYFQKNFDLLPEDCQSFLRSKLEHEIDLQEQNYGILFSSFQPTTPLGKKICHRLKLQGFMKKKKSNYYLTSRARSLKDYLMP